MVQYGWAPYVSVAQRRRKAEKKMAALRKRGVDIQPIEINGRKIAQTFWGKAWCDHLESFSDFENRLPRGRTYVRNGSVCHLAIKKGQIAAMVSGSEIYGVDVRIKTLPAKKWNVIKRQCSGQIGSLLELLRGDLSHNIMQVVTDREQGLLPLPDDISFGCNCPDWASMCKHIAAVMYAIGARLDQDPALLFRLRGVNHEELIDLNAKITAPTAVSRDGGRRLASSDLGDVFDIDLATDDPESSSNGAAKARRKSSKKKAAKKKAVPKKKVSKKKKAAKKKAVPKKAAKKKSAKKKAVPKKAAVKKKARAKHKTPETKGTKKVATRKKNSPKVAKKTNARKSVKKKPNKRTVATNGVKRSVNRKNATTKKATKPS